MLKVSDSCPLANEERDRILKSDVMQKLDEKFEVSKLTNSYKLLVSNTY